MTEHNPEGLGPLLRRHRDRVIELWRQRVLVDPAVPEANRLPLPALYDHIPSLLERLITTLEGCASVRSDSERAGRRIGTAADSQAHARERFLQGYKLPAALRELSHLRAAIGDLCRSEGVPMNGDEVLLLNAALDEAMAAAAEAIHQAAQAELLTSEERLAGIITSAMDAILSIDEDQKILVFNQSAERIFGVSAEAALGQPIERFIPGRFHAQHAEHVRQFGATGATTRAMGRLEPLTALRADGQEFPIEATLSQVQVHGRRIYTVVLRDVTERLRTQEERARLLQSERAAREAAEQSEFKFLRLANSGILGIVTAAGSGAIVEANPAFLRMVGYDESDVQAGRLRWIDMTPPEYAALDLRAFTELRQTGSAHPYEKEYLRKDGSRITVLVGIATLRPAEDTYIAYVLDVSARRRAEVALQQVARERDETLSLLDTFLSSAPVGFGVVDRELRYLRINETLAALNGKPMAAHFGRRIPDVLPGVSELVALVQRVFATGQPALGIESLAPGPAPGHGRHVLASFHPIRGSDGQIVAVGAIVIDITEQAEALQELQRHAAFRERLLAILGHDLRQPLSMITMTAEVLLKHEGLPEGLLRSAQRLARAAARMGRMIADLLDMARVRQGTGIPISPRPADLAAICGTVLDEIGTARPDRQILLSRQGDGQGTWDPDRLAQVVSNLVTNALDYGPVDRPVQVEIDGTAERVRMLVRNEGPPIAAELLPVLFDPFRRGSQHAGAASSGGLGLGLYIAHEIVRAHGGEIRVTSEQGPGTVFCVELPRVPRERT
ncbi:MAG: PAS domain S-box protein [Polyangia bacterium]